MLYLKWALDFLVFLTYWEALRTEAQIYLVHQMPLRGKLPSMLYLLLWVPSFTYIIDFGVFLTKWSVIDAI